MPGALDGQDAETDAGQDTAWDDQAGFTGIGAPDQHAQAKQQDNIIADIQPALQQGGGPKNDQDDPGDNPAIVTAVGLLFRNWLHMHLIYAKDTPEAHKLKVPGDRNRH
jgi:hypothetical protein